MFIQGFTLAVVQILLSSFHWGEQVFDSLMGSDTSARASPVQPRLKNTLSTHPLSTVDTTLVSPQPSAAAHQHFSHLYWWG